MSQNESPQLDVAIKLSSQPEAHQRQTEFPPHLFDLPGKKWGLWRWVVLRSAGFPEVDVLKLAAPDSARAADSVLALETEVGHLQTRAIDALQLKMASAADHERPLIRRDRRRLQKLKPPIDVNGSGNETEEEFVRALAQLTTSREEFHSVFASDTLKISQRIREVAAMPLFREAVIWQNRRALQTGINPLIEIKSANGIRDRQQRKHEEMVAKYLQRYCVKNDTIGFFGPVSWIKLRSDGESIHFTPGPNLVENRKVYFEGWCIDEVAEKIAVDYELQRWIAPRRRPSIRVDGDTLHLPFGGKQKLTSKEAIVLSQCNGERTAKQIADMLSSASTEFRDEEEVYNILDHFKKRGLIFWTFELHIEAHPELTLKRYIERVDDEKLREKALQTLDEMIGRRDAVAAAKGDVEKLYDALQELEATFTRLTGLDAVRNQGRTYAARTLVFEDCRRDVKMEIGPGLMNVLGPPLELILASSRWFAYLTIVLSNDIFTKLYKEVVSETGTKCVDFLTYWVKLKSFLYGGKDALSNKLLQLFQQRWEKVLALEDGQRRVHFTVAQLRQSIHDLFDVPEDVSTYVRYHSPDVMIAAESVEAIRKGDCQFVLGELHSAINTNGYLCFLEQHPSPEDIFAARHLDIPEPQVLPILPKDFFGGAMRTHNVLSSPKDYRLDFAPELASDPTVHALAISEFVLEDVGNGLRIRTVDGRLSFDPVRFLINALLPLMSPNFKILKPKRHNPRISIDRLIISRESWSFSFDELTFANEPDAETRFLGARRWAATHGIPRFVFVKAPVEIKPLYLDLDSPIYMEILAKLIRRMSRESQDNPFIGITEMLPAPNQLWLSDAQDNRYTSELRFVAVDCIGWRPPNTCGPKISTISP